MEGSHDRRLYSKERDEEDLAKEADFASTDREEYKNTLCATLTPQDVRLLVHAEDELSQTKVIFMAKIMFIFFYILTLYSTDVHPNLANKGDPQVFQVHGNSALC